MAGIIKNEEQKIGGLVLFAIILTVPIGG